MRICQEKKSSRRFKIGKVIIKGSKIKTPAGLAGVFGTIVENIDNIHDLDFLKPKIEINFKILVSLKINTFNMGYYYYLITRQM